MLAIERAVWEAWREHDAKKIADLTARDISFINIFGMYLATKADALKNWSGAGCDVKSVGVTDAVGTMLSPIVGILTFKGTADGTCYGQKVGPIWGTSVYVKDGDQWKWNFGINLPAGREGGTHQWILLGADSWFEADRLAADSHATGRGAPGGGTWS